MQTGYIKAIIEERGFGFISRQPENDVFFHISELHGLDFDETLVERRVSFDLADHKGRPRAVNVRAAL